ncbi:MAG: hypothetical protein J6B59_00470 [Alistipes sp.]|nr:hypothetical protein [Alistipes sp.]
MSRKRKITKHQLAQREVVERELEAIAPLSAEHLRLLSTEGFIDYYLRMAELYPTREDAYERLEVFYKRIFHRRKYADMRSLLRRIKQLYDL